MRYALASIIAVLLVVSSSCFRSGPPLVGLVLVAQTLPYPLVVAWDAPPGTTPTTAYRCYLDGALQTTVTTLGCTFPVAATGAHTVGVSTYDTAFIPPESTQATVTFTLKQPNAPANLKLR